MSAKKSNEIAGFRVELAPIESYCYGMKYLWQPDDGDRQRVRILDTILFQDGVPALWLFSSQQNNEVLRKKAERLASTQEIVAAVKRKSQLFQAMKPAELRQKIALIWFVRDTQDVASYLVDDIELTRILKSRLTEIVALQVYQGGHRLSGNGVFSHKVWRLRNGQLKHQSYESVDADYHTNISQFSAVAKQVVVQGQQHETLKSFAATLIRYLERFAAGNIEFVSFQVTFDNSWRPSLVGVHHLIFMDVPRDFAAAIESHVFLNCKRPSRTSRNEGTLLLPHSQLETEIERKAQMDSLSKGPTRWRAIREDVALMHAAQPTLGDTLVHDNNSNSYSYSNTNNANNSKKVSISRKPLSSSSSNTAVAEFGDHIISGGKLETSVRVDGTMSSNTNQERCKVDNKFSNCKNESNKEVSMRLLTKIEDEKEKAVFTAIPILGRCSGQLSVIPSEDMKERVDIDEDAEEIEKERIKEKLDHEYADDGNGDGSDEDEQQDTEMCVDELFTTQSYLARTSHSDQDREIQSKIEIENNTLQLPIPPINPQGAANYHERPQHSATIVNAAFESRNRSIRGREKHRDSEWNVNQEFGEEGLNSSINNLNQNSLEEKKSDRTPINQPATMKAKKKREKEKSNVHLKVLHKGGHSASELLLRRSNDRENQLTVLNDQKGKNTVLLQTESLRSRVFHNADEHSVVANSKELLQFLTVRRPISAPHCSKSSSSPSRNRRDDVSGLRSLAASQQSTQPRGSMNFIAGVKSIKPGSRKFETLPKDSRNIDEPRGTCLRGNASICCGDFCHLDSQIIRSMDNFVVGHADEFLDFPRRDNLHRHSAKSTLCPHRLPYKSVLLCQAECRFLNSSNELDLSISSLTIKEKLMLMEPSQLYTYFVQRHINRVASKCMEESRRFALSASTATSRAPSLPSGLHTAYRSEVYAVALGSMHPSRLYETVSLCENCYKIYCFLDVLRESVVWNSDEQSQMLENYAPTRTSRPIPEGTDDAGTAPTRSRPRSANAAMSSSSRLAHQETESSAARSQQCAATPSLAANRPKSAGEAKNSLQRLKTEIQALRDGEYRGKYEVSESLCIQKSSRTGLKSAPSPASRATNVELPDTQSVLPTTKTGGNVRIHYEDGRIRVSMDGLEARALSLATSCSHPDDEDQFSYMYYTSPVKNEELPQCSIDASHQERICGNSTGSQPVEESLNETVDSQHGTRTGAVEHHKSTFAKLYGFATLPFEDAPVYHYDLLSSSNKTAKKNEFAAGYQSGQSCIIEGSFEDAESTNYNDRTIEDRQIC